MMNANPSTDHESPAIQKHLEIMQGVITRMAENSRSCKIWCVTLVSAVLILVARTGEPQHALIALAPAILFYFLDAYYLALERAFRNSYTEFVSKLHSGALILTDLYKVAPKGSIPKGVMWAVFLSISTWPFYLMVVVTIVLAWQLVIPS